MQNIWKGNSSKTNEKKNTDLHCAVIIFVFGYIQYEIKFWNHTMGKVTYITSATKDQTHPSKTAIYFLNPSVQCFLKYIECFTINCSKLTLKFALKFWGLHIPLFGYCDLQLIKKNVIWDDLTVVHIANWGRKCACTKQGIR